VPDPTDPQPETPVATPVATSMAEPRQRWRLVVARPAGAPTETQRETADRWEAAFAAAALPLARTGDARSRARVSFGAPLPAGMAADGELIDIVLTERWPAWRVREALSAVVPEGWRLAEVYDVWLAGPALACRVAAADYRITLDDAGAPGLRTHLAEACTMALASRRLERQRPKGDGVVTYDLRPLIVDLEVGDGPAVILRVRARIHPELGTGRPEEVVAALGSIIGRELTVESIVRERLLLTEDLEAAGQLPPASASTAASKVGRK
jgi:radical SAM-linked protein